MSAASPQSQMLYVGKLKIKVNKYSGFYAWMVYYETNVSSTHAPLIMTQLGECRNSSGAVRRLVMIRFTGIRDGW